MQRFTITLAVASVAFALGVLLWFAASSRSIKPEPSEPLLVTVSPEILKANSKVSFDHYLVTVKNVSSKTIHGYSLGFTCRCRAGGTYGPYPEGINFGHPIPARQLLKPGQSQSDIVPVSEQPVSQLEVWADLVHFTDGTNWGPNQGRNEGYVRALE